MRRIVHRDRLTLLLAALLLSGCGLDFVEPEGEARLNLSGTVRSGATGTPVPGATVRLFIITQTYDYLTLASTSTDTEGRYVLAHHLRHVARDPELRGGCTIWYKNVSKSVLVEVSAPDFIFTWAGIDGTPQVQCTDAPQTLDFRLLNR